MTRNKLAAPYGVHPAHFSRMLFTFQLMQTSPSKFNRYQQILNPNPGVFYRPLPVDGSPCLVAAVPRGPPQVANTGHQWLPLGPCAISLLFARVKRASAEKRGLKKKGQRGLPLVDCFLFARGEPEMVRL